MTELIACLNSLLNSTYGTNSSKSSEFQFKKMIVVSVLAHGSLELKKKRRNF
jgi:hypothetical protein